MLGAGCTRQAGAPQAPPQGGIYRSDDQGVTFSQKVALIGGGSLARSTPHEVTVSREAPDTLYLAAAEGLFRTTTAGDRWFRLPLPAKDVLSVSVHPKNSQILLAAVISDAQNGRGKILKSLTGGTSWAEVFTAPAGEQLQGTIIQRRRETPTIVTTLAHDPLQPEVVLAGTNQGTLLGSGDGGIRWTTLFSVREGITGIKFSTTVPDLLFIRLASGRLLRSADGGRSADQVLLGREPGASFDAPLGTAQDGSAVHAVAFLRSAAADQERVLAGTENGLLKSEDGGMNWAPLPLPPTGGTTHIPVRTLAESADGTLWAGSGSVISISKDGGLTWRSSEAPLRRTLRFVLTDPVRAERLYAFFEP